MDLSENKTTFNTIEETHLKSSEQSVDIQLSLPEYCSDIRKILKCFVIPNVFACFTSGDRVSADGEALVRVIYVGEGEKLESYEQSVPFSKYAELQGFESDCSVRAEAETEYVNCRAVSQRRISISSAVCIHFYLRRIKGERLFSDCGSSLFETKREEVKCSEIKALCEKPFEMSETAALSENLPPVSSIIRTHTCACIDTVKTVSSKMLIKGDMITDIVYCTDSERGGTERYSHSMPISQIIDLEGADENSVCDVNVRVLSVCVSFKADSEGRNRLLDISVRACAGVSAYSESDICVVSDGYSTEYETESEFKNILFRTHIFTYNETKQIRANIDLSGLSAAEIIDAYALGCSGSAEDDASQIKGRGEIPVGILYRTIQGEYAYTERTVDFSFECRSKATDGRIICEPCFTLTQLSAVILSESSAEIRAGVNVSMPIFEENERRVCTKLEIIEDRKKNPCDCPLTVYFSSDGETLWDIARKYNTTCDRIKEDNELQSEELSGNTMLLICSQ